MTRYFVEHVYTGEALMGPVEAETPLEALDAYAVAEGFPPYSEIIADESIAADEREGWVHDRGDGSMSAVFTNYEIVAVPEEGVDV